MKKEKKESSVILTQKIKVTKVKVAKEKTTKVDVFKVTTTIEL